MTSHYYLGGRQVAHRKGSDLRYVQQDHLTGTSLTTDAAGAELATIKYLPFGGTRSQTGMLDTDRLFTGQRLDGTGLYFYNARYYDATIGRFISPDSASPDLANPQSQNKYADCFNNPLKYVDPTGREGRFPAEDAYYAGSISYEEYLEAYDAWVEGGALVQAPQVPGLIPDCDFQGTDYTYLAGRSSWEDYGEPYYPDAEGGAGFGLGLLGVGDVRLESVGGPFGIPLPVPVITARDSGLNLVDNVLDAAGPNRGGMAVGVVLEREDGLTGEGLAHEGQHIKEQGPMGRNLIPWLIGYGREYALKTAWYGWSHREQVYWSLSHEKRAREAGGEPGPEIDLPDDPWFWPW